MGNKTYYLKSGLFQKLIEKAKTEEEKNRIRKVYSYLNEN